MIKQLGYDQDGLVISWNKMIRKLNIDYFVRLSTFGGEILYNSSTNNNSINVNINKHKMYTLNISICLFSTQFLIGKHNNINNILLLSFRSPFYIGHCPLQENSKAHNLEYIVEKSGWSIAIVKCDSKNQSLLNYCGSDGSWFFGNSSDLCPIGISKKNVLNYSL